MQMTCYPFNLVMTLSLIINAYCFLLLIFGCHKDNGGRRFGEERRKNKMDIRK